MIEISIGDRVTVTAYDVEFIVIEILSSDYFEFNLKIRNTKDRSIWQYSGDSEDITIVSSPQRNQEWKDLWDMN